MQVMEAHVRRAVKQGEHLCGEVEVTTDDSSTPMLLAYFSKSQDHEFVLQNVVSNDASTETDWFDNNMHRAFKDMTNSAFQNVEGNSDRGTFEAFKDKVLSSGRVREELSELLTQTEL